ncbi:MAG: MoaD/ThiS family protein [Candidatus Thermoplasmatota archaeon]|nr:MoaD/ThiS family protein [Candidatus Thermoplasmatota archaeon]MDD5778184.1 MoaD/ThiS family protein [Candidatus Thermoplasmatota archaeon]
MELDVEMRGSVERVTLDKEATGKELLSLCNLQPDGAILVVNGRSVPYTERLSPGDRVRIIQVASGG